MSTFGRRDVPERTVPGSRTQPAPHETVYASTRTLAWLWVALSFVGIGLLAFLTRWLDLGVFLIGDEANFWFRRSEIFLRALQNGDYRATALTEHPGVTTMWLGSAGILWRDWLGDTGIAPSYTFADSLAQIRQPTVFIHVAGILLGYWLLRRLLSAATAALAALLWASDPFLIGHSRILHVDALAGTFLTLSLLAACVYWHHIRKPVYLALSSVCAALAILSKSPALAIIPVIGVIALAATWRARQRDVEADRRVGPVAFIGPLVIWGALCVVTIVALWPAIWVDPLHVYDSLQRGVEVEGSNPHDRGNFFLGKKDDAPGPLFYPVAIVMRLTPWTLLGLLLLPLAYARAPRRTRRDLASIAGFVVLFTVALSIFPKKFNRYLVPAFPLVDVLAAIGLVALAGVMIALVERWVHGSQAQRIRNGLGAALFGGIAIATTANAAHWHPYSIAAFNQLFGGARGGAETFLIGWGEGMEQVAAWLNEQPNITGVQTASPLVPTLQPYLRRGAQADTPRGDTLPPEVGYVVVYARQVQDKQPSPPFDQFYGKAQPLHTVRIHGVEYAWIYQAPPPVAQQRVATFGDELTLRGYTPRNEAQPGQNLILNLSWQVLNKPAADYTLFAHLIGPDGQRYAQVDLPYPTSAWGERPYLETELPLAIPADIPPGRYQLFVGLYNPADGGRLPLKTDEPLNPAISGPEALLLMNIEI